MEKSSPSRFWNKRIKLPYAIIIAVLGVLSLGYGQYSLNNSNKAKTKVIIQQSDDCPPPVVVRYRENDYKYTHPFLLADRVDESKEMINLKDEVASIILQKKQSGQITSASVYIRSLNDNKFTTFNADEAFKPGSLIKVPVMMTYLRESERNPGLLDKKLTLNPSNRVPTQTYTGDRIQAGKAYSIKQLLYYMIVKSDNYATQALNENLNIGEFKSLFTELGIPEPDVHDPNYSITAADYSKFFRVLYNATYISNENADYALTLLVQSDFKEGILKELPADIKVAHKFGETGDHNDPTDHQLHESGIIYFNQSPFLVTVMTKGPDVKQLPEVISEISKRVFDRMKTPLGEVTKPL